MTFECATNLTGYSLRFSYEGSVTSTINKIDLPCGGKEVTTNFIASNGNNGTVVCIMYSWYIQLEINIINGDKHYNLIVSDYTRHLIDNDNIYCNNQLIFTKCFNDIPPGNNWTLYDVMES